MANTRELQFETLVVGGGPAGMAAAVRARECGMSVGLVDDNVSPGGQIWRGESEKKSVPAAQAWFQKLQATNVSVISQARVFHQPAPGVLLAETPSALLQLRYSKLVLATGARERFLPFPGWTLPNVMGAGGLQALVKSGLRIRGKRVVVAGSGPLLLAIAAYLRKQGAEILIIAEQASRSRLIRFGAALVRYPSKIAEAVQLKRELGDVQFAANSWPTRAHGAETLEAVTVSRNGKSETLACDYLACGFHLVPNSELAALVGCRLERGFVSVNAYQETSVASVWCAGEPTGIAGLDLSLVEGEIAGFAAAGHKARAEALFRRRNQLRKFGTLLDRTFQLRPELKTLADSETILCRCEDVTAGVARRYTSWRPAKLQTRCGMGPCQGRVCGPAAEFLFDWTQDSVRPPIFPARVEALGISPAEYAQAGEHL